jgi:chemotaxis protein methyltransferase CheR
MEQYTLTDTEFRLFRELIYNLCGIALNDNKRVLVQSRLQKRLREHQLTRFSEYYDLIQRQGEAGSELGVLVNCITTNKTDFFREPHHFEFVAQKVVPEVVQRAAYGELPRRLRVWHAGCSTGEEPYSLAMTLTDALQGQGSWDVRQIASDIDTVVLAHAESGIYDQEKVAQIPELTLRKYFLRGRAERSGFYKVRPELRAQIKFMQINLLDKTWPFPANVQFDMIFCRNVVIYFDKPTQRALFARYQQALRPGGYLFIGHSESLLGISESFDSLGKTIYRLPDQGSLKKAA